MLSLVFNFCYYATFLVVPVVIFLLINEDENFHSKGGFLYLTKFVFGKRAIKKACKKVKIPKKYEEFERYDIPKPITNETESEALTFSAVDQEGNKLSVKITLLADHLAESTIFLKIGKEIYVYPDSGGVSRKHISGYQWKCQGLNVEISEPFKRYRILFNGFLRKISTGSVERIALRLTWNCCSKPNFSLVDDDLNLLAKCLAKTTWRDGNWLGLLGDEKSIVQFGALKGTISGEFIPEKRLNIACVKTKVKGSAEVEALNKNLTIFAATENGYLLHLGVKSIRNGCPELKYGHVLTHLGSVYPIKNCDLDLSKTDQSIFDKLTVHVEVPGKTLKLVLSMDNEVEVTNDNFKGFKNRNVSAECFVNNHRGFAILDCWTRHQGNGAKRPSPILRETKVETLPDIVVTPIGSEDSKILGLTGGKGCSLSLMKSLENDEIKIPDGFIVTTEAFRRQVEFNFNLRKAISLLEDIVFGREKGDLKNACEVTVGIFQEQIITPSVAQEILDQLMKHRRRHDEKVVPYLRWAVRSSGVGEDSEEFSSAGQNETFLGSQTDKDVLVKVCKCWASLYTYQSVMYRKQHGLPIRTSMAVVVQQMIPSECSGVLFTCHPSDSDPSKMLITSNFGLGETVVSGESEPDTFTLSKTYEGEVSVDSVQLGSKIHCLISGRYGNHKHTSEDRSGQQSLDESQAVKLGRVGVVLEEAFGSPRDVEWAFFKDQLYVLQSRPVTTLKQWTDQELLHEFDSPHISNDTFYTRANIGEVCPFALTALSYSTLMNSIDKGTQIATLGKYDPYVCITLRFSHHFSMLELLSTFYPRPMEEIETFNHMVDLAIFGRPVLTEEINRKAIARYGVQTNFSKLREVLGMLRSQWNASNIVKGIVKDEENLVIRLEEKDGIVDLFEKIDKALVDFIGINYKHGAISGFSMIYQFIVMQQLTKEQNEIRMENYSDIASILSCCGDVISAEVPAKLEEMAVIIRESDLAEQFSKVRPEEGVEWLKENCKKVYDLLEHFLEVHGHRLLGEMELSLDSWAMDPSAVIKMLQMNTKFQTVDKKEAVVSKDIVDNLKSPISNATKLFLRFLIKRYRKAVGYREISKSTLIKAANKFRIAYKTLAEKMTKEGLIPAENLIYHLTQYEIWQILHGKNPGLISKALRRQRLYPTWNKLKFPEVMLDIPVPENETEDYSKTSDSGVMCSGTPVCVGEVEGRAAVVTSLENIHLLQQGDVLITKSTDIGWSPYFPMLSGVVTELGGLVSHGAVVAREYGLPCLVGVQNATKMFKTGDQVFISGKNGVIKLLSR